MKIFLDNERKQREFDLLGKVICIFSPEHNMHWEFQVGKEYSVYKQKTDREEDEIIVLNDKSGYHRFYTKEQFDSDIMKDGFFGFETLKQ